MINHIAVRPDEGYTAWHTLRIGMVIRGRQSPSEVPWDDSQGDTAAATPGLLLGLFSSLQQLLWQPACQSRHAAFFEQGGPERCTAHPDFSHRRNPDFYGSARESTAFFSGSRFSLFPSKQVPQIMPVDHCFIAAELIPKLRIFLLQFVDVQLSPDRFILCQL